MTEASDSPEDQARAFLRELVDRYGVEGLTDRLAAAIKEAEKGRVAGPALDEATAWLEQEHGPRIASFAGEGHLTLSGGSAAGAMFAGTGHLTVSAAMAAEGIVHKAVQDVVTATDQAAITVTETARVIATSLPTNMQVMEHVHQVFWYLVGIWGLMDVPIEAVPFVLLMTLAIVVVRIRLKQG